MAKHETRVTSVGLIVCSGCDMSVVTQLWGEDIREEETKRLRKAHERFANREYPKYDGPEYEVASDGYSGD